MSAGRAFLDRKKHRQVGDTLFGKMVQEVYMIISTGDNIKQPSLPVPVPSPFHLAFRMQPCFSIFAGLYSPIAIQDSLAQL